MSRADKSSSQSSVAIAIREISLDGKKDSHFITPWAEEEGVESERGKELDRSR